MSRILQKSTGGYVLTCPLIDDFGNVIEAIAPFSLALVNGAQEPITVPEPTLAEPVLTVTVPVEDMPLLDTYTATWTGTVGDETVEWVTEVELVGGFLFTIAQLRGADSAFADDTKYPDATLLEVRTGAEMTIEGDKACAVAFVPRGRRVRLDGSGRDSLRLPDFEGRTVLSVTVDGTAWTEEQIATITVADDRLWLASGIWSKGHRNVVLHYTHGHDRALAPERRAALILSREYLSAPVTGLSGRATATSIGDQMYRITIAGRDGITGLPEVDAAIDQRGRKRFGVG